jgi:hypothetical protein
VKFEGTVVTIESFIAWKAKFDAEMEELNRKKGKTTDVSNKLTGKSKCLLHGSLMGILPYSVQFACFTVTEKLVPQFFKMLLTWMHKLTIGLLFLKHLHCFELFETFLLCSCGGAWCTQSIDFGYAGVK